jgi:hypothetical protein
MAGSGRRTFIAKAVKKIGDVTSKRRSSLHLYISFSFYITKPPGGG